MKDPYPFIKQKLSLRENSTFKINYVSVLCKAVFTQIGTLSHSLWKSRKWFINNMSINILKRKKGICPKGNISHSRNHFLKINKVQSESSSDMGNTIYKCGFQMSCSHAYHHIDLTILAKISTIKKKIPVSYIYLSTH